jgi:hypothetical protein
MSKKRNEGKFVQHARRELQMSGAFNKTKDYDGSMGRGLLAMVKLFVQWSGGEQAKMEAMAMGFTQLISGELLSPPTTNPDEWEQIEGAAEGTVRNKRCPFYLSTDFGATWTHIQNQETGSSANHLKENTDAKDSVTGSDEQKNAPTDTPVEKQEAGQELDTSVASESVENTEQPEVSPDKPEARTDS